MSRTMARRSEATFRIVARSAFLFALLAFVGSYVSAMDREEYNRARALYLENDIPEAMVLLETEASDPELETDRRILLAYVHYAAGDYIPSKSILAKLSGAELSRAQQTDIVELRERLEKLLASRAHPDFDAPRATRLIRIDGDLADWDLQQSLLTDSRSFRREYDARRTNESESDALARSHLMWSPDTFYVAVRIRDPRIQPMPPSRFWLGDHLLILIDASNQKTLFYRDGIYCFWISPGDPPTLGIRNQVAGVPPLVTNPDCRTIPFAVKKDSGGYTVEIAFPRREVSGFAPEIDPYIGFNFVVMDRTPSYTYRWKAGFGRSADEFEVMKRIETWGTIRLRNTDE